MIVEPNHWVNMDAVMDQQLPRSDRFWGVDPAKIHLWQDQWRALKAQWEEGEKVCAAILNLNREDEEIRQMDTAEALVGIQAGSQPVDRPVDLSHGQPTDASKAS
jgi:hypothetical protein